MKSAKWSNAIMAALTCWILSGCAWVYYATPGKPSENQLVADYNLINLKSTNAADVLRLLQKPEYELLSQSETGLAGWGQSKNGYRTWFTMVAFHEEELTAKHKYFFSLYEKPTTLLGLHHSARFDTELVFDRDVLDKPYANENARRIAILRKVLDNFSEDMRQVQKDNKMLSANGMTVNQTLSEILQRLDDTPALAVQLDRPAGLEFDQITLGKGRIRMLIRDQIVKVKIKIGPDLKSFEKQPDVKEM